MRQQRTTFIKQYTVTTMSELFLEDVLRLMVFVIRKTRRGRVSQKAGSASFNTTHWDQPLHKQSGRATTMLGILFFFPGTPLSYMSADAAKVCPRYFVFEEQQRHPNRSMIKRRVPNLTSGRVSDHDAPSIDFVNTREGEARTKLAWRMRQNNWNNSRWD